MFCDNGKEYKGRMSENMQFFIKYQGNDRYIATLHGKKLKSGKEYSFTEQDEIIFVQKNIWLSRFWWLFALFVVAVSVGIIRKNEI